MGRTSTANQGNNNKYETNSLKICREVRIRLSIAKNVWRAGVIYIKYLEYPSTCISQRNWVRWASGHFGPALVDAPQFESSEVRNMYYFELLQALLVGNQSKLSPGDLIE